MRCREKQFENRCCRGCDKGECVSVVRENTTGGGGKRRQKKRQFGLQARISLVRTSYRESKTMLSSFAQNITCAILVQDKKN